MRRDLDDAHLAELIELAYATTCDAAGWTPFLERYADAVGGTTTGILAQDLRTQNGSVETFIGFDAEWLRRYREYYSRLNVWITRRRDLLAPGSVATSQMICPDEEMLRSEYYADFLRPQDIFHGLRAVILREGARAHAITTLRPRHAGPFGRAEVALLRRLVPHLQRVLQLHNRLEALANERDAASGALDRLPLGVILLDSRQRPLIVNRAARKVLDQHDGLSLGPDGLRATGRVEAHALRRLLHEATLTACGRGDGAGGALSLPRPSLKRPLALLVAPLPREEVRLRVAPAATAVFISDPEWTPEGAPGLLRRLYALTPAESRLAALLVAGKTLGTAAEELQISRHTARTQLKAIFLRTGTCRQSELIRLVMSGPSTIRRS